MRRLKSVKPCVKCGSKMTDCRTDENFDVWDVSKCTNKNCDGWKDAHQMIVEGSKVEKVGE